MLTGIDLKTLNETWATRRNALPPAPAAEPPGDWIITLFGLDFDAADQFLGRSGPIMSDPQAVTGFATSQEAIDEMFRLEEFLHVDQDMVVSKKNPKTP